MEKGELQDLTMEKSQSTKQAPPDLDRAGQPSLELLNLRQKLELKDFLKDNSAQIKTHELSESTVQNLKILRKCLSFTPIYDRTKI